MPGVSFNAQQQQAINEYRQQNNLGYVVSDEAIVQEMIKKGKLPACFGALGQAVNPASQSSKQEGSHSVAPPPPSIFTSPWQATVQANENNTPVEKPQSTEQTPEQIRNNELKALGLQNANGAGEKLQTPDGKIYTVVGESINGRRILEDEDGNFQVISHDNKILNKDFVLRSNKADAVRSNPKTARNETVNLLDEQIKNAQEAFDKQMAEDGWAGDFADGISVLWGSENRASKVREDLSTYNENLAKLKDAAAKGNDEFKAAFKEMFDTDYDANAIANYIKNPSSENYQKAFGAKNNIAERVAKYNESQQTGAAAVKTTATIGAGIAIGVATGGAGLVAVGAAAAGTAAASAAINASDRMSSDVGLKDGELTEIAKNAAWDGASVVAGGAVGKVASTAIRGASKAAAVGRAAVNTAGDVAMGAAQEYAETGEVTAAGTAMNAAIGSVGIAAEAGAFKKLSHQFRKPVDNNNSSASTKDFTPQETAPKEKPANTASGKKSTISFYADETANTNPTPTSKANTDTPVSSNQHSQAVDTNTPATDNYLSKKGQISDEELEAFEMEADDIIGKAYSNKLENPKETLDKLEQAYKQTNNKSGLKMLNLVRKRLDKQGVKVYDNYSTKHASNSKIENIISSSTNMDKKTIEAFLDLDQTLALVDDQKVKKLIDEQLDTYIKNNGNVDEDFLFHLQSTVDTVNAYNGHYSAYKAEDYDELSAMARFSKMELPFNGRYLTGKDIISGKDIDKFSDETQAFLTKDLASENKLYPLRQYFKDNISADKSYFKTQSSADLSNHLYNNYYLKELAEQNVPQSIIDKCKDINDRLGVKVMIPSETQNASKVLETIDKEFTNWQKASGETAKMPPVIDFSTVKNTWFGKGAAGGYSEADFNGSLAFNAASSKNQGDEFVNYLRHEMVHSNDTKFYDEIENLDEIISKYDQEMKNAGISDYYVNYAHQDKREFIAVAAQGDFSKYSDEFKQVLVNCGMPQWFFDL